MDDLNPIDDLLCCQLWSKGVRMWDEHKKEMGHIQFITIMPSQFAVIAILIFDIMFECLNNINSHPRLFLHEIDILEHVFYILCSHLLNISSSKAARHNLDLEKLIKTASGRSGGILLGINAEYQRKKQDFCFELSWFTHNDFCEKEIEKKGIFFLDDANGKIEGQENSKFWNTIKGDLLLMFQNLFRGDLPLFSLNVSESHLYLKPICLLNVAANRMNAITIQELHKKNLNGLILKIDFEKWISWVESSIYGGSVEVNYADDTILFLDHNLDCVKHEAYIIKLQNEDWKKI
ncbi:hypothetical protein ACJX0J_037001 [Zea mays]